MQKIRQSVLGLLLTTMGSGCFVKSTTSIYDKPFRLTESSCASVYNPSGSLESNTSNCRTRLSCIGNAVTPQTFDVIQIKKTGQYWRSVMVQNLYIPQLDIAFELIDGGVDIAGRVDGDGSLLVWQTLNSQGSIACLLPGACTNSESTFKTTGSGDNTVLELTWASGCKDTFKRWVDYCGPLEPCEDL